MSNNKYFMLCWIIGCISVIWLLYIIIYLKDGEFRVQYHYLSGFSVLLSFVIYSYLRVFNVALGIWRAVSRLAIGWTVLILLISAATFLLKESTALSRLVIINWFFGGYIIQIIIYCLVSLIIKSKSNVSAQEVMLVGDLDATTKVAESLIGSNERVTYTLCISNNISSKAAVKEIIKNYQNLMPQKIYLTTRYDKSDFINDIYFGLIELNIDIIWVPDLSNISMLNHSVVIKRGVAMIILNESPLTSYPTGALLKSILDYTAALVLVVLLMPLIIIVSIIIKITSKGPVIYKQDRHGYNGKIFSMWKFRSMLVHQDVAVKQAKQNDSRVTQIGRLLRRTSFDEIPQLFNVLVGQMSLVGPRPHAVEHNNYYSSKIYSYMQRHRVKPGLTGLAQINGARGETETLDKMKTRVEYDINYINNWSLLLDLKIIIKTPYILLKDQAY